jgi:RimJ/RimL family protein N-acetyltransferase
LYEEKNEMIGLQGKILRSSRLTYRLLTDSDKADLLKILSEEHVTRPGGFLPADSEEKFDIFFETLTKFNTGIAILLGEVLIGYVHVNKYHSDIRGMEDRKCVSLGFVIGESYWRQGYGSEMLTAITGYLLGNFEVCFAECFIENIASRKTIEKCGYEFAEEYSMYFDDLKEQKQILSYYCEKK